MKHDEIVSKLEELKTELIKSKVGSKKTGKLNTREIKRTIARLITINKLNKNKK
jgi:ribosomal protein L29